MKRVVFVLVFISSLCFGQDTISGNDLKIPVEQLKEDFLLLASTINEVHPAVHRFISKDSLDKLTNAIVNELNTPLSEEAFHLIVRRYIRVIGCGHLAARPSEEWYKNRRGSACLIPLNVYISDDLLYVREALECADSIQPGWEILSINGVASSEILKQLYSIHERDGFNQTFERKKIEKSFQTYYLFLTGNQATYNVEFESKEQQRIMLTLNAIGSKPNQSEPTFQFKDKIVSNSNQFGILAQDSAVAVIDLNSFDSRGYKKFYKKGFKMIRKQQVEHLIIDLRGNGGGYFPNGNQLLRYVMPTNFSTNFWSPKKKVKSTDYLTMNPGSSITRRLFNLIPDKDKNDPNRNYEIRYRQMKRKKFDGNLVVFIDGGTFSMGSVVASTLKNKANIRMIGEETGGGEAGFNAVLSWDLELLHSKIRVTVPNYHIDLLEDSREQGRGVIPDVLIQYAIEERIDGKDLELEYFLQNLRSTK